MVRLIRAITGFPNVPAGFPIILTNSLEIIEPLFRYLLYVATIPGRSHSPETLRTYAEHLLDFFDTLENTGVPWDQVTKYIIATYRNNLMENPSPHTHRPYTIATINARIRTICRFYQWAHECELIPKLPFHIKHVRASARRRPFLTHTESDPGRTRANDLTIAEYENLPHAISLAQLRRLFARLEQPYSLMAEWALTTGLRRKELCGLTTHQIPEASHLREADDPFVNFPIRIAKGGKPRQVHVPIRVLDRTHRYISEVREQLVRSCRNRDSTYHPPDELFLNSRGQRVTPQLATRKFAKAFRSADVRASLHWLRHTYAITTYNALCRNSATNTSLNPLKTLQILLGHESITTTAVYLRSTDLDTNAPPPEIAYLHGDAIEDQYSPPAE